MMNLLSQLKEYIDVGFAAAFLAFWALYRSQRRTIQIQKLKLDSANDNAQIAPIQTEALSLDKQMEALDAERLQKEADLNRALGSKPGNSGRGSSSNGSKPVP